MKPGKKIWLVICTALMLASLNGHTADPGSPRGYLGVGLKTEDDWLTIGTVAPDSPASRAGLKGGERILKINGRSTENRSLVESGSWLAGPAGDKVTLTLLRPGEPDAQPFEVTILRVEARPEMRRPQAVLKRQWSRPPTREAGAVEWEGNKIKSRVLPYPDFISFFIRLPLAHAFSTGKGINIAVVDAADDQPAVTLVQNIVPGAVASSFQCDTNQPDTRDLVNTATNAGWRIVVVSKPPQYPGAWLAQAVEQLTSKGILVVLPADLSEDDSAIEAINKAHALGALTVGRVNRQSTLTAEAEREGGGKLFNRNIRNVQTDVFSTTSLFGEPPAAAAATAAGVAALVLEKSPEAKPGEVRQKIIDGARPVWQASSIETGRMAESISVDPVTTKYVAKDEKAIFRFRVLDAAGALGVETSIPWFLNMLNCEKAWEITKGDGVVVAVTDQGFHLKHPELAGHIEATRSFGPLGFDSREMNFHGTDMIRILLAVAPGVRLLPILCSGTNYGAAGDLASNIAHSFEYAAEAKAGIISGSWSATFASNNELLKTIRTTVDQGVLVSWFHFPKAYAGILRPTFTYAGGWAADDRLGLADRFLVDPPGFHPAEIEAGLSATAPQAAGVAALVRSVNRKLTPAELEQILLQTATPIGGGILVPDAWKAVVAAKNKAG